MAAAVQPISIMPHEAYVDVSVDVDVDVNGDGRANDRPYVFEPVTTPDPFVADGLRALLANGAPTARQCLANRLGAIVDPCRGPWSLRSAPLNVTLIPSRLHLPQRVTWSCSLNNPLGAMELLLRGSSAQGWGQQRAPASTLLHVVGFDPNGPAFRYRVNPDFGSVTSQRTQPRVPAILSTVFGIDVGPSAERADTHFPADPLDSHREPAEATAAQCRAIPRSRRAPLDASQYHRRRRCDRRSLVGLL